MNKQVLTVLPVCPLLNTSLHFGVGSLISLMAWKARLQPGFESLTVPMLRACLPLALLHCVAVFFTNVAISKVNLSLVHTIKAAEPLYAAFLSLLLLKRVPRFAEVGALSIIVLGVVRASVSEVSFNMVGFCAAMASNLAFCLKNIFSVKVMGEGMDELSFLSVLTIGAFCIGLPFAMWREWAILCGAVADFSSTELAALGSQALAAGVLFHFYQISSIVILSKASAVTHSVVNTMKRPVLILISAVFFHTEIRPWNGFGVLCAVLGAYLYGRVKAKR